MTSVKVAVRVRPLNQREDGLSSQCIIQMEDNKTRISNPKIPDHRGEGDSAREQLKVREFTFDHSFWSLDESDSHFVSQEQVFAALGEDVVSSAFDGYNVCIFAYGQTGSGKTHTMMGYEDDPGLIPRFCNALFCRLHDNSTASYQIHVSYLEIYNEKVRDLLRSSSLDSSKSVHNLRVREHPRDGPYVQDLSKHSVISYDAIASLMNKGNANRTTAATNMNDVSSRSHAIFTIIFTQARFLDGVPSERQSKINLVDLAGSERADSSGATGQRLKEGGSINKSLVSLGNVISLLAERSESGTKRHAFIPYRDSVLTWLLKDSLGGNAKTVMIATISPADVNYGETLSTLRYANRAKNIINRPTVNEDPNVKLIRELREEIARLRSMLEGNVDTSPRMQEKLHENEARVKVLTEEWAEKWNESASLMREKSLALRHEGVGVVLDSTLPHLIGISDDILSTGVMLFHLKEGITKIGSDESDELQDITISGASVEPEHCVIEHKDGVVVLHPIEGSLCAINGQVVKEPTRLVQGMLITLGQTNMYRYNNPEEAKEMKKSMQVRKSVSALSLPHGEHNMTSPRLSLLSQSMSDLYRSNESLALNGSLMDVSSTTYREDQEELEHKRLEIMELENKYTQRETERLAEEQQIKEELDNYMEKLRQLNEEIEFVKSKKNPYNSIVDGLRQLDRQEEELLEDLRISKENLLKEIENLTWYPDQVTQEEAISQVIRDLERQISEKSEQIEQVRSQSTSKRLQLEHKGKSLQEKVATEVEKLESLRSQYEMEKKDLLASSENILHEVQDLSLREDDLVAQHELASDEKNAQWKLVLDELNEHTGRIEEAWHDLADNEARVKRKLHKGNFSSAQEKLECEAEAQQLAEARKLLEEEEKTFAQHQHAEMARIESELEVWERQKAEEVDALHLARRELLWQNSDKLRQLDGQIEEQKQVLVEAKDEVKQADKEMAAVVKDFKAQIEALEEESSMLTGELEEMEKRTEEKESRRKDKIEELEVEIETLEHTYNLNLADIQSERMRLVGLQEEVLRKSSLEDSGEQSRLLNMSQQLKAQKEDLDTRQKELEAVQKELEAKASELESRQLRFDEERETQLDKIEFEKFRLLDMERQDRLNSLVDQEVKCRMFEEKLERDRLRKLEREKDKQERDKEIQRLKSIHQREINQLKAKLEMSNNRDLTSSGNRVTRSQSCETMTSNDQRKNLIRQLTFADPPAVLNIEVPTFVLRGSGRDLHYEYLVKVTIGDESWCIFRRYSRFREMHNALKKKYPVINQLVFPPRRFFHKNKKVAAERRTLLEEYVRHAVELCMRIPECPLNPAKNRHITKQVLLDFEPFFRRGLFETSRNLTS
ncbi:hypothetical protein BsWGS_15161 [Bradybaena similaris]